MNFPQNVKYTNEHEWIRLEGDVAYVGITDYAQESLGNIVYVDMPEVDDEFPALEENPELVNKDPYGEGWLIKMKPANAADLDNLLDAEGYKAVVNA